jgi:hypothetical protein
MDLKEIFQTMKDISEKEEDTLWNETSVKLQL